MALCCLAMSEVPEIPGFVVSSDEIIQPADAHFEAECKAEISDISESLGYVFKSSILTKSEKWGLIWRVDFEIRGRTNRLGVVNRVVCWRKPDQAGERVGVSVGFGQRISPI